MEQSFSTYLFIPDCNIHAFRRCRVTRRAGLGDDFGGAAVGFAFAFFADGVAAGVFLLEPCSADALSA